MGAIEDQIQDIEDEIQKTSYNKATQHHIGKLKAKLSRLREEAEKRASAGGGGQGYSVRKSGNATVGLVGFPSVGKSTLLNEITDADSEVGSYEFTTLDVVPGTLVHKFAKIQLLDLPGLVKGAAGGKGRGREVISVIRTVDLILFITDVFDPRVEVMANELYAAGIRLNTRPPDVVLYVKKRGGIVVNSTVELTHLTEELVQDIVREYGKVSAEIVIREDITVDQLIDYLSGNRIYIKSFVVLTKTDLADKELIDKTMKKLEGWDVLPISAPVGTGLEELREKIYDNLEFINIFMRPQGHEADMDEPMVVKKGSTVAMICATIHRDFTRKFRYAKIWGKSAKFPGQTVGLNHEMLDGDILTIVIRR